jgi:hypothetical protein
VLVGHTVQTGKGGMKASGFRSRFSALNREFALPAHECTGA